MKLIPINEYDSQQLRDLCEKEGQLFAKLPSGKLGVIKILSRSDYTHNPPVPEQERNLLFIFSRDNGLDGGWQDGLKRELMQKYLYVYAIRRMGFAWSISEDLYIIRDLTLFELLKLKQ